MIYVAGPYSSPDAAVRELRYNKHMALAARLIQQELPVYSPIVHNHLLAIQYGLPTDAKFWEDYNYFFLTKATSVVVGLMEGWQRSKGLEIEIGLAKTHNIPLVYCHTLWTAGQKVDPTDEKYFLPPGLSPHPYFGGW